MDTGHLIDLRARRPATADAAQRARDRFVAAHRASRLSRAEFAAALSQLVGWPIPAETVTAWQAGGIPPGDVLIAAEALAGPGFELPGPQLIVGYAPLQAALGACVTSARQVLAITGSRSRDADYLALVEQAVVEQADMTHYRVLYGPPRHGATKQHLLRLIDLELPTSRLHVGMCSDLLRDQERFIVASEHEAIIVQPSITSIANFDTAVRYADQDIAAAYVAHVRQAYLASDPITSRDQVERMEVVR